MNLEVKTIEYKDSQLSIEDINDYGYELNTGNGDFLNSKTLRELADKIDELNSKESE